MTLQHFQLNQQLQHLAEQQRLRHTHVVMQGGVPYVSLENHPTPLLNFSSNDYLGLAHHPQVIQAATTCAQQGYGAGAAHLITGHTHTHAQLEQALAAHTGYAAAQLFSSGFAANVGIIDALMRPHRHHGLVLHDKLNHASLIDGVKLSGAKHQRFRHRDYAHLEYLLQEANQQPHPQQILIVTDLIFSMDGTQADIAVLKQLAAHYSAALMVDDAHGFLMHTTPPPPVDIYMATLGKAAGTAGAFVAGDATLIQYLRNMARSYMFSTATPASQAAATLAALHVAQQEPWRSALLQQHIHTLRHALNQQGWHILHSNSAIQPIILQDEHHALALSHALKQANILALAIRPPTVPTGSSRIRITLSAAHQPEHIDYLIQVLGQLAPQFT